MAERALIGRGAIDGDQADRDTLVMS